MKIIKAYPPNFAELKQAFPIIAGKQGVLYSWGDRVYNPSGGVIPVQLLHHEATHYNQQVEMRHVGENLEDVVKRWWEMYIHSMAFRILMEVPAHVAEYRMFMEHTKSPKARKRYLADISSRLSGPLYGHLFTEQEAQRLILEGQKDDRV